MNERPYVNKEVKDMNDIIYIVQASTWKLEWKQHQETHGNEQCTQSQINSIFIAEQT